MTFAERLAKSTERKKKVEEKFNKNNPLTPYRGTYQKNTISEPILKTPEKPSVSQALPSFHAATQNNAKKQFEKANNVEKEAEEFVSIVYQKYGNTDSFRDKLEKAATDFTNNYSGNYKEAPTVFKNTIGTYYTESLLTDLKTNPTIDNYNSFVNKVNSKTNPLIKTNYNGSDSLAVASSIMYQNNKDFTIDNDAYAKKVFAEDEKAISDLEKKKKAKQKEQGSVSSFSTLNDLGAEIGDMGLQAAGILIPGKFGDKLENEAAARRDARQDKKEESAKIGNEISEIDDEIKLRKANLEWNKKYYDVSKKSDFAEKNHRIDGKNEQVIHPTTKENVVSAFSDAQFKNGVNGYGLTKEQVEVFYYIYNTKGAKEAEQFLKDMRPLTNPGMANFQYELVKDTPVIKQLTGVTQNLIGGTMGQLEGIANAGASLIGKTVDFTVDPMTGAEPFNKEAKGLEKGLYGVAQGVGQMLPAIATRGLGGTASQVVFGAGVYGNTYKEAKDKGYDQLTSMGYGIANTAMELALEEMGGFTVGGGKGKLSMPKAISSKIDDVFKASPKTRAIASIGANMAGQYASEFTEEYLAATFDPILRNVFLSENNDFTLVSEQQLEDGLIGGFTGLILGSPTYVKNIATTFKKGNYGAEKAFYIGASDSFIESEMLKSNPDAFKNLSAEQKSKAIIDYRLQKLDEAGYSSIYGNLIKGVAEGKSLDGIKSDIADEGVNVYDFFNDEQLDRAYTIAKQTTETLNKTTDADVLRRVASDNAQPMSQETILDTARKLINDGKSNAEIIDTITTLDNTKAPNDVRELVRSIKDTAFINSFPSGMTNAQKAQAIKDYIAKENELDLQYINSKAKTPEATNVITEVTSEASEATAITSDDKNVSAKDAVVNISKTIKDKYKKSINGAVRIADISAAITPAIVDGASDEAVIRGLADLFVNELEKKQSQTLDVLKRGTGDRNTAVDTLYEYALTGAVSSGKDAKKVTKVVEPFKDIADSAISQVRNARSAVSNATVPVTSNVQEAEVKQADVTPVTVSKTENVTENQENVVEQSDVEDKNFNIDNLGASGKSVYKSIMSDVVNRAGTTVESNNQFIDEFKYIYSTAASGKNVDTSKVSKFTEDEVNRIVNAAKNDTKKVKVVKKEDAHLIKNDAFYKANVSKREERMLKAFAKLCGRDIIFSDTLKGNAQINLSTGVIEISVNAKNGTKWALIHEAFHALKADSPAEANSLQKTVIDIISKNAESFIKTQAFFMDVYGNEIFDKDGKLKEGAEDYIKEEMVADMLGYVLSKSDVLSTITGEQRNILQKFIDKLTERFSEDYLDKAVSEDIRQAYKDLYKEVDTIAKQFKEVFDKASKETKNTVSEDGGTVDEKNSIRHSMVGLESKTANKSLFEKAESMIDSGVDSETVRQETGWYKGYDGKWKYEIDDSEFSFYPEGRYESPEISRYRELADKVLKRKATEAEFEEFRKLYSSLKDEERNPYRLKDYIEHEKLFNAYPQLENIGLNFQTPDYLENMGLSKNTRGFYDSVLKKIVLNEEEAKSPEKAKQTLMHEIQHVIQEIEGFAKGSNPEYWEMKRQDIADTIKGARQNLDLWLDDIGYSDFVKSSMQDVVTKKKTLDQHWRDCEKFKANSKYAEQIKTSEDEIAKYEQRYEEITNGMTAFEQYENTAGEIEARDTANRLNLNKEERKNTRPDIDREKVLFAENSNISAEIVTLDNGKKYWSIDTKKDIFGNLSSTKELQNAAYDYILHGEKGEHVKDVIDGEELQFRRISAKEFVYGEASKALTNEAYKQKMRLSPSIIDLIDNAFITYDSPDHKSHTMFPDGFKNFQGRVGIDNTIFRYIVRVGVAKNGKVFYDINLEVDVKVPDAKKHVSHKNTSTSKNNYTQNAENVNTSAERNSKDLLGEIEKVEAVDKTTRHSYSSIANTFYGNENMTSVDFLKKNYKDTEGYKNYVEKCLDNMRQSRENFDENTAREEIEKQIDGIVRVALASKKAGYDIVDSQSKRDVKDSKSRLLFSSLEPNSDYFTSSDISTICDKRKNFAEIYDEIVRIEEEKGVPEDKRFFANVDNYFVIHKIMADMGLTQPCRQCYVESMRKNLAPMANAFLKLVNETDAGNKSNDQLYSQSGKTKGELKSNNAKLREAVLKTFDEHPEYNMSVSDLTVETLTTEEGLAQLKLKAPLIYEAFNSFYGQSKPKMPKAATPFRFGELTALLTDNNGKINQRLVDKINSTGGFRLQSYSDFQIQNYVDVLQVLFEAGTLGLNGHAYTKVPAFLEATDNTNLKRNISIFMYKDGSEWKLDKNDSFPYDLDEIYEIVEADKSGNTGIIAVSQNKDMSCWIMANDMIGYGIPFHKSGLKMGVVRDTDVKTEDGRVIKGYAGTIDHTKQQTEVWAKTTDGHKALTKVSKGINIYSFWDFDNASNLSKNELIEKNLKRYIDECEKAGYFPKFRDYVMNNGAVLSSVLSYAKELGYASKDATVEDISFNYKGYTIPYGYHKFLGDFSMFTPDGKASGQKVLSLENYDFDKAVEFFDDAEGLRRNEILQQFSNGEERAKYRDSNLSAEELERIVDTKRKDVAKEVTETRKSKDLSGEESTRITMEMSDAERTKILSAKSVVAPFYEGQADSLIETNSESLNSEKMGLVKAAIISIGKQFDVFGKSINIEDVEVEITLSKSNLKESVSKKVTPTQLAKLLPILKESVSKAIGIERHDNRYYFDSDTVFFDNLLGGYVDGDNFVPIRFGLKHSLTGTTTLYVVVDQNTIPVSSLEQKNKTKVVNATSSLNEKQTAPRLVEYSLPQIVSFVKSKDLLRYLPDEMLNDEQKTAKWEAISETIKKTNNKNDEHYFEFIKNGNLDAAKKMVDEAAKKAGYTVNGYHGTGADFNIFSEEKIGGRNVWGKGFYFGTNKSIADDYASWRASKGGKYRIVSAKLKMNNPFIPYKSDLGTAKEILDRWFPDMWKGTKELGIGYINGKLEHSPLDLLQFISEHNNIEIKDVLQEYGYDSIKDGGEIVVFESNQIKSADPVTYDDNGNVIPLSERFDEGNADIRWSEDLSGESEYEFSDEWEDKVEEFGAIPKGENPVREVNVPKKISKTQPVSQFARTMMEADVTPEFAMSEFEKRILDGTMTHEVITNKGAEQKAINEIEYDGFADSLLKWQGVVDSGKADKYTIVKGQVLYNQCITSHDVANAMKIAADLTDIATQAGQTLQACRVLKLMSPDGQLYYLEKSVKKMNEEFREKLGKKYDNIVLDEDLMKDFLEAESEEAKKAAYDELCVDIANQIPSTLQNKWDSWRYLAMLGNPRTHIRNIFGNAMFVPAIRLKNHLATIGERIAKVPVEERRRSHRKTKEAIEFAKEDFAKVKEIITSGGSKYTEINDIEEHRTIFKTKWLEYLRKKNFDALELEDAIFLKSHYVDTLARIITARKLDVNNLEGQELEKLRTFAIQQAAEYTYRDANALATELSRIERKMQTSKNKAVRATSILLEGFMPFKKTPLNIAKQGVMYSPIGIITGISKAIKSIKKDGDVAVQDAIDDMSKGISGTGIVMLGYFLASLGLISSGDEEDVKKSRFDRMVGEQSFSFNVGDHSYTIDWMAPASLPLFVGVALSDLMKDDGLTASEVFTALGGITDPLFELSVLSGVSDAIDAAKYSQSNPVTAMLSKMGVSYIMQALPTIGGQFSRIIDSQKREYSYVDKNNKYLPASIQKIIGQAAGKFPGASFLFTKSVDEWGRDESYGGFVERFLENTVSPGYYSKANYTEVDNELLRLYNETKDNVVFPPSISKSFSDGGIKYNLTAKEYEEYKRDRGQRAFKYVYDLIHSTEYNDMSNAEKTKAIEKCYERARDEAKLNYLGSNELTLGRTKEYKGLSEEQAKAQGYFTKDEYSYVENELFSIMEDSGVSNLFPTEQNNYYTVDGEKHEMTEEQHKEATFLRYNKSMELLLKFFNDEKIKGVKSYSRCKNNDEIIDALKDIYRMAGDYTKDIMLDKVLANSK